MKETMTVEFQAALSQKEAKTKSLQDQYDLNVQLKEKVEDQIEQQKTFYEKQVRKEREDLERIRQ